MNFDEFRKILGCQKHAGYSGFEGLIAKLLEFVIGQRFYLCLSGTQGGKDISNERLSNIIMVECKHYKDKSPPINDLLAKFVSASHNFLPPDLWIIVTTTRLGDQHRSRLLKESLDRGVAFSSIDAEGGEESKLTALCACAPKIVAEHLEQYGTPRLTKSQAQKLEAYLTDLAQQADVITAIEGLKKEFSAENIGYADWHKKQNSWLSEQFQCINKSKASFAQNLAVADPSQQLIIRKSARHAMNTWINNWSKQADMFVILGEEGDGKTWAAATWFSAILKQYPTFPPVLFIPSVYISKTVEPNELIINAIKQQLREPRENYWKERLDRWLTRPVSNRPLLTLVIDGLNESHNMNWSLFFAKLAIEPYVSRVAVLITCRKTFWEDKCSSVQKATEFLLQPYDDNELEQALKIKNLSRDILLNEHLISLLRIPRYFDMMARLYERMDIEGEITKERLIYEDWRDKLSRKNNSQLMSHEDFLELMASLSEKLVQTRTLSRTDILAQLESYDAGKQALFDELKNRTLERDGVKNWTLSKNSLILGLLLAEEVQKANCDATSIDELVAYYLEPQPDMDMKVSICGTAFYHALSSNFADNVCLALFKAWLKSRNIEQNQWLQLPNYIPKNPRVYLTIVEWLWSSDQYHHVDAQNELMTGFLKFRESKEIQKILVPTFEHWMGFIHLDGHNGKYADEETRLYIRQNVVDVLGTEVTIGSNLEFFDYVLNIVEDEALLRLPLFALAIISHQPRVPYIQAIVTGVITVTIMGVAFTRFQEELAWVLRTSKETELENLFLCKIQELVTNTNPVFQKASWRLLRALGTEKARELSKKIPDEYQDKNPYVQFRNESPCDNLFLWSDKNYREFIDTANCHPQQIVLKLREVALNPNCLLPKGVSEKFAQVGEYIQLENILSAMGKSVEDSSFEKLESALCAYHPERFADLWRKIVSQLPVRTESALQQIMWKIYEHMLIMGSQERSVLKNIWHKQLQIKPEHYSDSFTENLLFPCILRMSDFEEQLELLIMRGEKTGYFFGYESIFNPIDYTEQLSCLTEKLSQLTISKRYEFLWTIGCSLKFLDDATVKLLPVFSDINDEVTSKLALEVIYRTEYPELIQSVIQSDWNVNTTTHIHAHYWGSMILSEYGHKLSFAELVTRISINLLGYAVEKRGYKQDEILAYGELLNTLWCGILKQRVQMPPESEMVRVKVHGFNTSYAKKFDSALSIDDDSSIRFVSMSSIWGGGAKNSRTDLNLNPEDLLNKQRELLDYINTFVEEQRKTGNPWLLDDFNKNSLSEVVESFPKYVEQWLNVENSFISRCRSFYEVLCEVLLDKQPENGIALYRKLRINNTFRIIDSKTGIQLFLFGLFKARDSIPVIQERKTLLDMANRDSELFEIVLLTQLHHKTDWLNEVITEYLSSAYSFEQAKGIMLLGCQNSISAIESLDKWTSNKLDYWVLDTAHYAKALHERNQWAQHWFKRFLTHSETLQAWAAFRLFLRCVDRRYWLWEEKMFELPNIPYERIEHHQACYKHICDAAVENEKEFKLSEKFLGQNVLDNKVCPWMENYL
jgi:hypothetical protein